ncbi:MAG: hypothetical protein DYG88_18670 [Chloroflexi bacterium CFX4]|nr:hypothetical protein [Chloroflexi bacterium CFX4]MDL1924632.1 hypothetical protein [Chloroflexi bacterium CFX3]
MIEVTSAARAYWRLLGILEGLAAQIEHLEDYLPSDDRRVAECYDALVEALEIFQQKVRRSLGSDEDDEG